jgi:hypothetical protein
MGTHIINTYKCGYFYFPSTVEELPYECRKYFKDSSDARLDGFPYQYNMVTCIKSFSIEKKITIQITELN